MVAAGPPRTPIRSHDDPERDSEADERKLKVRYGHRVHRGVM
jgi:hypothetical protein